MNNVGGMKEIFINVEKENKVGTNFYEAKGSYSKDSKNGVKS